MLERLFRHVRYHGAAIRKPTGGRDSKRHGVRAFRQQRTNDARAGKVTTRWYSVRFLNIPGATLGSGRMALIGTTT